MSKCPLIQDLLPLYLDGLTREEAAAEIRRHLEECPDCQKLYTELKKPLKTPEPVNPPKEINYLKKIKAAGIKKIALSAAALICLFALLSWLFAFGMPVKKGDMEFSYRVADTETLVDEIPVQGKELLLDFELLNGKELRMAKSQYIFEDDGKGGRILKEIILKPYQVLPSPLMDDTGFLFGYSTEKYQEGYAGMENSENPPVKIIIQFRDEKIVLIPDELVAQHMELAE